MGKTVAGMVADLGKEAALYALDPVNEGAGLYGHLPVDELRQAVLARHESGTLSAQAIAEAYQFQSPKPTSGASKLSM